MTVFFFAFFFRSDNKVSQNRKVTDFFPVRRSNRKTKSELKVCIFKKTKKLHVFIFKLYTKSLTQFPNDQQSEEHRHLDGIIKSGIEEGLRVI